MLPVQPDDIETLGVAWIASQVLRSICQEATATAPLETGGILLGYWSESPVAPVITYAIGPGPAAKHERSRFVPDHEFHEIEVARLWNSNPAIQYLGDWHSHPGAAGYLSEPDFATLRRIAKSRKARAPRPLMVILEHGPWNPVAWSLRSRTEYLVWKSFVIERWTVRPFGTRYSA